MAATQFAAESSTSQHDLDDIYEGLKEEAEDLDKIAEANELFDAVLTGSVNQDYTTFTKEDVAREPQTKNENASTEEKAAQENSKRRLAIYIGNFPWWTSDKDLMRMAQKLGVMDIIEIQFAENKVNGQSRGYAELVVKTEESLKKMLERAPQCKINGERVNCRFATRQNLTMFEDVANKRIPMRLNSSSKESSSVDKVPPPFTLQESSPHPTPPPPPLFPPHPPPNSFPSSVVPPFLFHPPPLFPPMTPGISPISPPSLFPPQLPQAPGQPSPSFHLNPAFFNPQDGHSSSAYSHKSQVPDGEFEELMTRNQTVASTAITKAVSGATAGNLQMAMETLLTAIAVIKQSRVYGNERCQALVTSLKDCLVSIQGHCGYSSSRSREKERGRDRERDRERERERDRERYRERDRDYSHGGERESSGMSQRRRERSWSGERDKRSSREWQRDRHR